MYLQTQSHKSQQRSKKDAKARKRAADQACRRKPRKDPCKAWLLRLLEWSLLTGREYDARSLRVQRLMQILGKPHSSVEDRCSVMLAARLASRHLPQGARVACSVQRTQMRSVGNFIICERRLLGHQRHIALCQGAATLPESHRPLVTISRRPSHHVPRALTQARRGPPDDPLQIVEGQRNLQERGIRRTQEQKGKKGHSIGNHDLDNGLWVS